MENSRFKTILKEWIIPFAIEIIVVLLLIKYVFFLVRVPTGSMIPTINEGTWLFATRVHQVENVERGDILVFDSDELGITLIKRLIGLPGETVEVKADGSVYVNGEKLSEEYVVNQQEGVQKTFEVPQDSYLFFGDNRSGSLDARSWEDPYIEGEKIIGQGRFTIWPLQDFGVLK